MLVFENFDDMFMDVAEQLERKTEDTSRLSVMTIVVCKVVLEGNQKRLEDVTRWYRNTSHALRDDDDYSEASDTSSVGDIED